MNEPPCYVFKNRGERPSKRRRVEPHFSEDDLKLRLQSYDLEWGLQADGFEQAIQNATTKPLDEVMSLIAANTQIPNVAKIPTGLIVTSPSASSGFLERVQARTLEDPSSAFVTLRPSDGPNLKSLLKNLIQRATKSLVLNDEEDTLQTGNSRGPLLLNYDLQILYDWSKAQRIKKIVIALKDSETFDVNVFAEFVSTLHSWLNRLQFVLLIGVATSVDIFQDRLPPSAIQCMNGQGFDVTETTEILEQAFKCSTAAEGCTVHPGPGLADLLVQRSKDHLHSVGPLMQAVKYMYMCHFFGNPIAAFLKQDLKSEYLGDAHFEAIRNLPSFQIYVEHLLINGEGLAARELLDSNDTLFKHILQAIPQGHARMEWLCGALSVLHSISAPLALTNRTPTSFSTLYVKSLAGTLTLTAPLIREILLHARTFSLESITHALEFIISTIGDMPPCNSIPLTIDAFTNLQSEIGIGSLTKLQTRFHALFAEYLNATLLPGPYTAHIPFHEIYFYDLKLLHRDAFMPRPRFVLERALGRPHDYLGCTCCAGRDGATTNGEGGQSRTTGGNLKGDNATNGKRVDMGTSRQPATAILYQLTLESGTLINVQDLWTAFRARVAGSMGESNMPTEREDDAAHTNGTGGPGVTRGSGEEREGKEILMRALFFRGLAELKYLGIVRQSRKKADCLQRVLWGGL